MTERTVFNEVLHLCCAAVVCFKRSEGRLETGHSVPVHPVLGAIADINLKTGI